MREYILEIEGLSKQYTSEASTVEVLRGLDLKIKRGEIVVIMGQSGVGKSTLLGLMATIDEPTDGKIIIDGADAFQYNEQQLAKFRNEHIGIIFQFHHLLPDLSALENVMMPRMIKGNGWQNEWDRAETLLTEVGLGHRLKHRPNQLSGGEQQRVAIARAFMNNPRLILADEPTGDLDRKNSEALFNLILELNRKYQQTFVIVTHDEMFADQAHRIVYLADGKVDKQKILRPA